MKRKLTLFAIALAVMVTMLFPAGVMAETTAGATPAKINYAKLKWEKSLGTGYMNAPTPPIALGDYIYTFSGKTVYKLDKNTGATAGSVGIGGTPGYATTKLATNGKDAVYAMTSQCKVVKVNVDTMTIVWTGTETFEGQNVTPLVYENGHIYGGTWGDKNDQGTYFSISDADGSTDWKLSGESNEGYYWAGACLDDSGNYAIFGSDGTYQNRQYAGTLYAVDIRTGVIADTVETIKGQIRSTVVKNNGKLYFTSNQGYLYEFAIDASGQLSQTAEISIGASSVNTPIIAGSKLYVGNDKGKIFMVDLQAATLTAKNIATAGSAIKGEMLYSTTANCLYAATYQSPGAIYMAKLNDAGTAVTAAGNLYTPAHKNYGLYPITASADGTLYYKNDSGYIMALTEGYDKTAPTIAAATATAYNTIKVTWKAKDNIKSYQIKRSDGKVFTASATATAYTDKTALTGKKYAYQVRALCGETTYSSYSAAKSAKTSLGKTKVTSKAGKKKIVVSWKKVRGAKGYYVYRATKKSGKYIKVKVISKTKWTNTKLKKGKKYYYKVKAYRTVNGKKVFGSWSNVTYKKVK